MTIKRTHCIWCGAVDMEQGQGPSADGIAEFLHLYIYGAAGRAVSDARVLHLAAAIEALKEAP